MALIISTNSAWVNKTLDYLTTWTFFCFTLCRCALRGQPISIASTTIVGETYCCWISRTCFYLEFIKSLKERHIGKNLQNMDQRSIELRVQQMGMILFAYMVLVCPSWSPNERSIHHNNHHNMLLLGLLRMLLATIHQKIEGR